ncbi:MAG: hypothetical protein PHD71_00750 [Methanospirillum sp.]|nr:hypothetical protein [Methanospirillum sp.]
MPFLPEIITLWQAACNITATASLVLAVSGRDGIVCLIIPAAVPDPAFSGRSS